MKYGLFMMPSHPPERNIYDAHQWDLEYLTLCDELGFDEAWIGEHRVKRALRENRLALGTYVLFREEP